MQFINFDYRMRDESPRWQQILAAGFTSAADLLRFLNLPVLEGSSLAEKQFATRVPRGFALCMEKNNPRDPLLLQVLAVEDELQAVDGFVADPLQEAAHNPRRGLIHKYAGRVLMTVTGACAVNCRYCFRRHFPYQDNNPGRAGWGEALDYIAADTSLHEVIFSGGDPLLAPDSVLFFLITALEAMPHIQTLRIHTRIPVVLPARVDASLCQRLKQSRLHCVIVLHANHPHELSDEVLDACTRLRESGCHLLNQSVLLKNINDNTDILVALSMRLFACGVLPYYLHLLDKVQGAAHFEVPKDKAQTLFHALQRALPGYLVPRLAQELPGAESKMWINK